MQIKWTEEAVSDLAIIKDYIETDNPVAAQKIALKIVPQIKSLIPHPIKGRPGRVLGTRESLVPDTSYFIVYRVNMGQLEILRVLHSSRRYPA